MRLVPSLAALIVAGSAIQAAEDPAPTPIAVDDEDVITVTATRLDETPYLQPYAFYSYDRKDLDTTIGHTALDRLNYGPGVFIQHTTPAQTSPFIRGLTGEQSLLLLDGVRLSHAMMRPGPNQYAAMVPDVSMDRIDVILGSSSLVNGSDGLTGALDFRLAEAGRGVDTVASPFVDLRVDSANGAIAQTGVDGRYGDWAYTFEVDLRDFHDRVGGNDFRAHVFGENTDNYEEIPNTAYDQWAFAGRTAYTGIADHR
ncbi:MAG: TonB-dependent receptor, partial [Planctomycetota bacterium]